MLRKAEHQRNDEILQALHQLAVDMRAVRIATDPAPWNVPPSMLSGLSAQINGGNG